MGNLRNIHFHFCPIWANINTLNGKSEKIATLNPTFNPNQAKIKMGSLRKPKQAKPSI